MHISQFVSKMRSRMVGGPLGQRFGMHTSRGRARAHLAAANEGHYRDIVLASDIWDKRVTAIFDRYLLPTARPERNGYRSLRRKVSWEYQLQCYARFSRSRPSLLWAVITYWAWRRFLVASVCNDLQRNAFTGVDAWLNVTPEVRRRQQDLRQAQVEALQAELRSLMAILSNYEQLSLRCSVAVVCEARSRPVAHGGRLHFREVIGPGGLSPIKFVSAVPLARH